MKRSRRAPKTTSRRVKSRTSVSNGSQKAAGPSYRDLISHYEKLAEKCIPLTAAALKAELKAMMDDDRKLAKEKWLNVKYDSDGKPVLPCKEVVGGHGDEKSQTALLLRQQALAAVHARYHVVEKSEAMLAGNIWANPKRRPPIRSRYDDMFSILERSSGAVFIVPNALAEKHGMKPVNDGLVYAEGRIFAFDSVFKKNQKMPEGKQLELHVPPRGIARHFRGGGQTTVLSSMSKQSQGIAAGVLYRIILEVGMKSNSDACASRLLQIRAWPDIIRKAQAAGAVSQSTMRNRRVEAVSDDKDGMLTILRESLQGEYLQMEFDGGNIKGGQSSTTKVFGVSIRSLSTGRDFLVSLQLVEGSRGADAKVLLEKALEHVGVSKDQVVSIAADGADDNRTATEAFGLSVDDIVVCANHGIARFASNLRSKVPFLKEFYARLQNIFRVSGMKDRMAELTRAKLRKPMLFFPDTRWGLLARLIDYLKQNKYAALIKLRRVCMVIQAKRKDKTSGKLPGFLVMLGVKNPTALTEDSELLKASDDDVRAGMRQAIAQFDYLHSKLQYTNEVSRLVEGDDYLLSSVHKVTKLLERVGKSAEASAAELESAKQDLTKDGVSREKADELVRGVKEACDQTHKSWSRTTERKARYFQAMKTIYGCLQHGSPVQPVHSEADRNERDAALVALREIAKWRKLNADMLETAVETARILHENKIVLFDRSCEVGKAWRKYVQDVKDKLTGSDQEQLLHYAEAMRDVANLRLNSSNMERKFSMLAAVCSNQRQGSRRISTVQDVMLLRANPTTFIEDWASRWMSRSGLRAKAPEMREDLRKVLDGGGIREQDEWCQLGLGDVEIDTDGAATGAQESADLPVAGAT